MKRIIRLTENDLTRIVRRVIKEQEENPVDNQAPVLPRPTFSEKEIEDLQNINKELTDLKNKVERDLKIQGGPLLQRIRNRITSNRIIRNNKKIEAERVRLQKDFDALQSGKMLTPTEKEKLIAGLGAFIGLVSGIIAQAKTNFATKFAKNMQQGFNRE